MANFVYVPILRWKKGEQGALKHMDAGDRQRFLPVLEVQNLEQGAAQPKLTEQMVQCAGVDFPIAVDLSDAYNGPVPHNGLADVCHRLTAAGVEAWPTVRATAALADLSGLVQLKGFPAVVIRARAGVQVPELDVVIASVRRACGRRTALYLVLDLYALGDRDPATTAASISGVVAHYCADPTLTQVIVAGGSFPMSLAGLNQGINNLLLRREVAIWKALRAISGCEDAVFGDYGVTNPEPLEEIDPTRLNPAAAIRYALTSHWRVIRGSGVKSKGKGGMKQYNGLCQLLLIHPDYSGKTYSFGDDRYHHHAQPGASSGNYMTWRRDATSHHLVLTVRNLVAGSM